MRNHQSVSEGPGCVVQSPCYCADAFPSLKQNQPFARAFRFNLSLFLADYVLYECLKTLYFQLFSPILSPPPSLKCSFIHLLGQLSGLFFLWKNFTLSFLKTFFPLLSEVSLPFFFHDTQEQNITSLARLLKAFFSMSFLMYTGCFIFKKVSQ